MKNVIISLACIGLSSCGSARATSLTSTNMLCSKTENNVTYASTFKVNLSYSYNSYVDATGTNFVNCSVVTLAGQFSNTVIYKSTQTSTAALTGACVVTALIYTTGVWTFTSQSGVTSTIYNDIGTSTNPINGHTYTFVSSTDCSTN